MILRPAQPADLATLTDICFRSKAHWGYSPAFMEACRDELTMKAKDLRQGTVHLAQIDNRPVAVAQLHVHGGGLADLDKLFVAPEAIGKGTGAGLFGWAVETARAAGARGLDCQADPFAEGFYLRMGMSRAGEVPSSTWPGRLLPLMSLAL